MLAIIIKQVLVRVYFEQEEEFQPEGTYDPEIITEVIKAVKEFKEKPLALTHITHTEISRVEVSADIRKSLLPRIKVSMTKEVNKKLQQEKKVICRVEKIKQEGSEYVLLLSTPLEHIKK